MSEDRLYGLAAEFDSEDALLKACRGACSAGYYHMEAYAPYPVKGLDEALGRKRSILPVLIFLGGMAGAITGYGMQWYAMTQGYPLNVGGRPLHSWPSFIPVTFELTVLFAAITAIVGMLFLNRLPRLHHPVFETENFDRVSQDRFFLCIESDDALFEANATRTFLKEMNPISISEVPLK